jgi:hypothetical protein
MPAKKNVQDAHMSERIRALHGALLSIVHVMNRPEGDDRLIGEAGIALDRALFPLLVLTDYTTVSRQMAKLEHLGLVARRAGGEDRRVREAVVTPKGQAMTDALDAARERLGRKLLANWEEKDLDDLVRLLQKFAKDVEIVSAP